MTPRHGMCFGVLFFREVLATQQRLGQYRTNELVRWRMHFLSDGRKGIASAADELCGSALGSLLQSAAGASLSCWKCFAV